MKRIFSRIVSSVLILVFIISTASYALAEDIYSLEEALNMIGKDLGRIEISNDFTELNIDNDGEYTYNGGKIIILWREAPLKEFEVSDVPFTDDYTGKDIGEAKTYLCTDLMERVPEEYRAKTPNEVGNVIMIETLPLLSGEIISYEDNSFDYTLTEEDVESLLRGENPSVMAMVALMQKTEPNEYKPVFETMVVVSLYNADTGSFIPFDAAFYEHDELRKNPEAAEIWDNMQYYGAFLDEFIMVDGKISVTAEEIDAHLENIAVISQDDYETFSKIREESIFPDLPLSIQSRYWEMAMELAGCEPNLQTKENYENAIKANDRGVFSTIVNMQSYSGISKSDREIRNDLSYIGKPDQAQMEEMLLETVDLLESILEWELVYLAVESDEEENIGQTKEYKMNQGTFILRLNENNCNIFTNDNDENSLSLSRTGYDKSQMDLYVDMSGMELYILPLDAKDTKFSINVKVRENKYPEVGSFLSLSEREWKVQAKALIAGFGASEYETVEKDDVRYCVFDGFSGLSYQRRYATIHNGSMIYIYASREGEELRQEDIRLLEEIVNTAEYL